MNQPITQKNRNLVIVVAALMISVFFLPLWKIRMGGNQFPEPLIVNIWVDKITGGTDYDLYTINDFNHYVGMKKLKPDSIPELKYMPYILAFMILGAVVTIFHNRLYMVWLGLVNLLLVGIAGMVDFYKWLYDYGTDMDTTAALYNKDVDFQPPLIACKKILNVTTCSWPNAGAFLLIFSIGILGYIIWSENKKKK